MPPAQKAVEGALTDLAEFQVDRFNLNLFVDLLGKQEVHYPCLTRDMFVRMYDWQVAIVGEVTAKQICYIDGASGSLPTLYIERSGAKGGKGGGPGNGKGEVQGKMEDTEGRGRGRHLSLLPAASVAGGRTRGRAGGRAGGRGRGLTTTWKRPNCGSLVLIMNTAASSS